MKKYKKYFIITLMLAFVFSFSFTSLPVSAASKYGTYGRRTYYYTVSKAKNIRIEKRGKAVGKYLNEWMEGGVKLAVSYAMGNYSIPFSIVEIMVGDGGVKYDKKSYSSYVFQAKYTTRNIFYYQDNAKKKVLSIRVPDQLYSQMLAYAEQHKMTTTDIVLKGVEILLSEQKE